MRETLVRQEELLEQLMANVDQCENEFPAWRPPENGAVSGLVRVPELRIKKLAPGAPSVFGRTKSTWVYRYFAHHIKPIPSARWFVNWLMRNLYPIYTRTVSVYLGRSATKRWRPLVRLQGYVATSHISTTKVFDAVRVDTPIPKVFPIEEQAYLESPHDHYVFPPVYIAELSNAHIYGGTNLVFLQDAVICHDLYDFERDYTSEELHGRHMIDVKKMRMRLLRHDRMPDSITEAAAFVDACAPNYAHWLTEVLPRIAAFCTVEKFATVPIIINDGLHPNIMESLALIVGPERDIITLPVGRAIQLDKLYLTSVAGYVPFERRNAKLPNHAHGMFCSIALQLIRDQCFSYIDNLRLQEWPDKVYLRRISGTRQVANRMEIEQALLKNGYVAVEPEKLSFIQQVGLFNNAESIVASSGAAVANLMFAEPMARVNIFIGKVENTSYWYWQNIARSVGNTVNYFLGVALVEFDGIHSDFEIDQKLLTLIITEKCNHG